MIQNFKNIIEIVKENITKDIKVDDKALDMVLKAYNRYQLDENEDRCRIYDINVQKDFQQLVNECGVDARQIQCIMNEIDKDSSTSYVVHNAEYDIFEPIRNVGDLQNCLITWLDDILRCVIMYACRCKEYEAIYERYITEVLEKEWANYQ